MFLIWCVNRSAWVNGREPEGDLCYCGDVRNAFPFRSSPSAFMYIEEEYHSSNRFKVLQEIQPGDRR